MSFESKLVPRVLVVTGVLAVCGAGAGIYGFISADGPSSATDSKPSGQGQIGTVPTPPTLTERACRLSPSTVSRIKTYECRDSGGRRVIASEVDGDFRTSEEEVGPLQTAPDGTQTQVLGNGCTLVIRRSASAAPDVSLLCP